MGGSSSVGSGAVRPCGSGTFVPDHVMARFRMILLWLTILVVAPALAFAGYFALADRIGVTPAGERQQRIEASPNFKDGKFQNVVPTSMDMKVGDMLGVLWEMTVNGADREPKDTIPTVELDLAQWNAVPDTSFAVAWFGHSSLLIKMGGVTFLVDPVFGERASTFSFAGPKRFAYREHMRVDLLPAVDVVLLSHDHYDHLDHETLLQLLHKQFIVPLGVGSHLERWGVPPEAIVEKDWWQGLDHRGVRLTLVPARHFSGRGLMNRFSTLWGAWVIEQGAHRILFGADSGYSPTFKEIGARFGPFDLVLLECGAYNERWSNIHMMPEETAMAAVDLRARALMPIHWAKFNLALHPWKEPIERLVAQAATVGMPLLTPRIGSIVVDADSTQSVSWWRNVK
jgi:L-ascorbate metabolism protein UlaG (beta-lactamase superfamily)